jgi:hypothetical protein
MSTSRSDIVRTAITMLRHSVDAMRSGGSVVILDRTGAKRKRFCLPAIEAVRNDTIVLRVGNRRAQRNCA